MNKVSLLTSAVLILLIASPMNSEAAIRIRFQLPPPQNKDNHHDRDRDRNKNNGQLHYEVRRYDGDPWHYYYPYRSDNWRYDYHELAGYSYVALSEVRKWEQRPFGRTVRLENGMEFQVIHPGYRWPKGAYVRVFARGYDTDRWYLGFRNGRFGFWLQPQHYVGHTYYRLVVNGEVFKARRVD